MDIKLLNPLYIQPKTNLMPQKAVLFCGKTSLAPLTKDVCSFSKRDFLDLPKEKIFEKIKQTICDENSWLGQGREGIVFRIIDTDYCMKISPSCFVSWNPQNISFDVSKQDKANHIRAILNDNCVIQKFIQGMSLEKCPNPLELCELPFESYYNLYKQISNAAKENLSFDDVANNIIYNPENKSLTAIDFSKESCPVEASQLTEIFASIASVQKYEDFGKSSIKKLFGNILKIVAEECNPDKKSLNEITDFDVFRLVDFFRIIYSFGKDHCYEPLPENYKDIQRMLNDIIYLKNTGSTSKEDLLARIQEVESLIDKTLICDK